MSRLTLKLQSLLAYSILGATLVVFGIQLRSLYTVPVYDSVRWGGDETWLMREFGNQATHGVMAYPESFGGPTRTDGVLAGSMWIDAVIYGATGAAFFPPTDYITVGRTVTACLGMILIASVYFILRKLQVSNLLAALSAALLVMCQGFVWASHSARYDLLTGLSLIWFCYFLSQQGRSFRQLFFAGAVGVLTICFSRHLLFLGLAATLVFLYRIRIWKSSKMLGSWLLGSVSAALLLSLAYYIGAGEFSFFGRGGSMGSYSFVIGQIPIMRPFSRNVQISNLIERHDLFRADSPGLLILLTIVLAMVVAFWISRFYYRRSGTRLRIAISNHQRFYLSAAVVCTLAWLLMQGSRPYYLYHIAPLLVIATAIVLQLWNDVFPGRWFGQGLTILLVVIAVIIGAQKAIPNKVLGEAVATDQQHAVTKLLAGTPSSPKPRILFDVAGLDRALQDTSRQVLTLDMFAPPPHSAELVQKLKANHIDYVVLRSSPVSMPFEPGRALIPKVLDSIGEVQDSVLGFFYDDGRSYDDNMSRLIEQGLDTLRLYRVDKRLH